MQQQQQTPKLRCHETLAKSPGHPTLRASARQENPSHGETSPYLISYLPLRARARAMEMDSRMSMRHTTMASPILDGKSWMGENMLTVAPGRPLGIEPTTRMLAGAFIRPQMFMIAMEMMVTVSGPRARSSFKRLQHQHMHEADRSGMGSSGRRICGRPMQMMIANC